MLTQLWLYLLLLGASQVAWASLVAQLVKNPPAMWETCVWSLGWEDPLEKGKATTPVFWPGEFHGLCSPWGCRVGHNWVTLTHSLTHFLSYLKLGPFCDQKGLPRWLVLKNPPTSAGDVISISGLRRSPGEGNSNPLQYSGLENPTDCVVHGACLGLSFAYLFVTTFTVLLTLT